VPPFVNSNGGLRRSDSQNLLYVEEIFLDGEEPVLSVEEILLSVEERLFHVEEVLQDGKTCLLYLERPPLSVKEPLLYGERQVLSGEERLQGVEEALLWVEESRLYGEEARLQGEERRRPREDFACVERRDRPRQEGRRLCGRDALLSVAEERGLASAPLDGRVGGGKSHELARGAPRICDDRAQLRQLGQPESVRRAVSHAGHHPFARPPRRGFGGKTQSDATRGRVTAMPT
jgi:hypothetical protein